VERLATRLPGASGEWRTHRGAMKHVRGLSFNKMAGRFQLKYIQEQCEEVIADLDISIKRTEGAAPVRKKRFMLGRTDGGKPSGKEAVLERWIWREFGPSSDYSRHEFLPGACLFVRSFQVPLKSKQADSWGKIDLLGVAPAPDLRPVVIELKHGGALDTPLRFLVEAVGYGIALRKVWNASSSQFRLEWVQELQKAGFPEGKIPRQLETVTLICAAPEEYWNKCTGLQGSPRAIKPEGWRSIRNLVRALQSRGFRVKFVILPCSSVAPGGGPRGVSVETITPWDEGKRKPVPSA